MYSQNDERRLHADAMTLLNEKNLEIADLPRLRSVLIYADWKYYVQSEPVLSDSEYDTLFQKLKNAESLSPDSITPDSPTQRIAQGLSEKFSSVMHLAPMLSLDNTYNADDLKDWNRRCQQLAGEANIFYCVEPKYDGAGISLVYENGRLVRGATRGDGISGEDITANIKQIMTIPVHTKMPDFGIKQIEIRGEIVIHKSAFEKVNAERAEQGLTPLANPRNAASGTLRMLDPTEVRRRKLNAVIYHISYVIVSDKFPFPIELTSHYSALNWLYSLGFPTPAKEAKLFDNISDVIDYCDQFEKRRDELPYEVDGLVIKVNDFTLQEKMGTTSHHPRWAVAFKFKARQATSKLKKVAFQVGRTGAITPVAKINEVLIGGVTVTSVSLFNEDVVRQKDLRIGDSILVERAGDVIPYIVKALPELRDGSEERIIFPTTCPACGSLLEKQPDEVAWRCINVSCPAQAIERIMHYASRDAMDIKSLGAGIIQKLYNQGILSNIAGIYHLDWERVRALDGFGERSVTNLMQAIEESKHQPLYRLIFGMGIRYVGEATAKTLAKTVSTLQDFYQYDVTQLITLEDVGPKVASAIVDFFLRAENRDTIALLSAAGVHMQNDNREQNSFINEFAGKTFLFTGTLTSLNRSVAEELVEAKGGTVVNGVSKKLNYLVVGTEAGNKLEKAKKIPSVHIISEREFLDLVQETN